MDGKRFYQAEAALGAGFLIERVLYTKSAPFRPAGNLDQDSPQTMLSVHYNDIQVACRLRSLCTRRRLRPYRHPRHGLGPRSKHVHTG